MDLLKFVLSVFPVLVFFFQLFLFFSQSGTTNPTVKLLYVDLEQAINGNVTLIEISHPSQLDSVERILAAVQFPTNDLVAATWMNRIQNEAYVQLCQTPTNNCTTVRIKNYNMTSIIMKKKSFHLFLFSLILNLLISKI